MSNCFLGLGSNLGDRLANLKLALVKLEGRGVKIIQQSCVYQSSPVDCEPDQNAFLNMVVKVETTLEPVALVELVLAIEYEMGRRRTVANASREIDIDVLVLGDKISLNPVAILPHPRLAQRLFVLVPLRQLVTDMVIVGCDATVQELYLKCREESTEKVELFAPAFELSNLD